MDTTQNVKTSLMIVLMIILIGTTFGNANAYRQPSVNNENQFRAQNQFFIDDFNRIQQEQEMQRMREKIRRIKFEREVLEPIRTYPEYRIR